MKVHRSIHSEAAYLHLHDYWRIAFLGQGHVVAPKGSFGSLLTFPHDTIIALAYCTSVATFSAGVSHGDVRRNSCVAAALRRRRRHVSDRKQ